MLKLGKKHLLLSAFLIIFLFLNSGFAFALEVTSYPPLPGLQAPSDCAGSNCLPVYIVYWFGFLVYVAGVLALISFVVGAVGLIVSGDNPELAGNSKDRMKGAVLGLVLVIASFLIIKTINPTLITPTLTPLPQVALPTPPPAPGVYYYTQPGCAGDGSGVNTASQDYIPDPFNGNIKSVKIIDDATNDINYGVIFHEVPGLKNGGMCSYLIAAAGCHAVNIKASAADIFLKRDAITYSNYNIFGFGITNDVVTFFSAPYGWATGANAGFKQLGEKDVNPVYTNAANLLTFDYTHIKRLPKYQTGLCPNFQTCPGSIKLKGKYIIALYAGTYSSSYCQTFTADVPNLNVQPFIASGTQKINMVIVYATK